MIRGESSPLAPKLVSASGNIPGGSAFSVWGEDNRAS